MSIVVLPDLNLLPAEALRTLLLTTHEQLLSTTDKLTVAQEQLQSRDREIEHLQLLLAKLHRMQFGRKSEKLTRQIEQLELRLKELESNGSEPEPKAPEPPPIIPSLPGPRNPRSSCPAGSIAARNSSARAERNGVPKMPGGTARVGWRMSRKCWST